MLESELGSAKTSDREDCWDLVKPSQVCANRSRKVFSLLSHCSVPAALELPLLYLWAPHSSSSSAI